MLFDAGAIFMADLILSGDNALIIGMAAAGLSPELRGRAIFCGMMIAAMLRIILAVAATKLLAIPGLLFVGGTLLFRVCWRLYCEIRTGVDEQAEHALEAAESDTEGYVGPPRRGLASALWTITLADVSMSLDNVLAVAAIADGHTMMLVVGPAIAIVFMAFAATLIMKLLATYQWISWAGLAVLVYVAAEMLCRGVADGDYGIGPMLGLMEGIDFGRGH